MTRIGRSLHGMSGTRWSARLQCFRPFASHINDIQIAMQDLLELNLTAKTRNEMNGVLAYQTTSICVPMLIVIKLIFNCNMTHSHIYLLSIAISMLT